MLKTKRELAEEAFNKKRDYDIMIKKVNTLVEDHNQIISRRDFWEFLGIQEVKGE